MARSLNEAFSLLCTRTALSHVPRLCSQTYLRKLQIWSRPVLVKKPATSSVLVKVPVCTSFEKCLPVFIKNLKPVICLVTQQFYFSAGSPKQGALYTEKFNAALFSITKNWKQTHRGIVKEPLVYPVKYFLATKILNYTIL